MNATTPVPGRRWWRTKDLSGQKFGHLTLSGDFTKGAKVCGHKCPHRKPHKTHGMSSHPAYAVWRSMCDRCRLPSHQAWHNYGARGITVCKKWEASFSAFWEDMGASYQQGLTLERLDNSKGYSKKNCAWVTSREQGNNRRVNTRIQTPWGELTVAQASRRSGINVTTLLYRIEVGVPPSKMFVKPDLRNRFTT
jgi:hypothetical protein